MDKIVLSGLLSEEITQKLELSQGFRGKQIFKWIYSHVKDFSDI